MALPQMGLVQDGTKCGEGLMCMNTNCVPVTTLPTLNCPGTKDGVICSGHGVRFSCFHTVKVLNQNNSVIILDQISLTVQTAGQSYPGLHYCSHLSV